MSRVHLFEWVDQPWFPALFRDFITDHLVFHVSKLFAPAIGKLADAMQSSGYTSIVDLCSGGGGPIPSLLPKLSEAMGRSVSVTLTDLYPNVDAFAKIELQNNGAITCRTEPTSAMDCPEQLVGFRTMFTALHHFHPEDATKILKDAVEKGVPIASFEAQERNLSKLIVIPLIIFVGSFILTPFVGRLTIGRIIFTYLIPLGPLFFTWDAVVSCLRTYSPKELEMLTNDLKESAYRWEIGQISTVRHLGSYRITYLIGHPPNGYRKINDVT